MSPKKTPPEHEYNDPQDYFKGEVLHSYIHSKSMMRIQEKIANRALNISNATKPGLILDLGMGAGFSSILLQLKGFTVIGLELIWDMLTEYAISELNPIAANMVKLPFRNNTFDFIFSISAFQWVLSNDAKEYSSLLTPMIMHLYRILKKTGVCVFQFYESRKSKLDEIYAKCTKVGFTGKYIIDNPQSKKKKKYYLYLEKNN